MTVNTFSEPLEYIKIQAELVYTNSLQRFESIYGLGAGRRLVSILL